MSVEKKRYLQTLTNLALIIFFKNCKNVILRKKCRVFLGVLPSQFLLGCWQGTCGPRRVQPQWPRSRRTSVHDSALTFGLFPIKFLTWGWQMELKKNWRVDFNNIQTLKHEMKQQFWQNDNKTREPLTLLILENVNSNGRLLMSYEYVSMSLNLFKKNLTWS